MHNFQHLKYYNMAKDKNLPRMLYLSIVYLAVIGLYALSSNSNYLDAFHKMRNTLDQGRLTKVENINLMFSTFENTKLKEQPDRAKPIYDKAKKAQDITNSLDSYIKSLRLELQNSAGGVNEESGDVKNNGNIDASPRIMINGGKGKMLKSKIEEANEQLKSLLVDSGKNESLLSLIAAAPKKKGAIVSTWQEQNFGEGIPVTAALTNLARIETDIINYQGEVVKVLLGNMDKAVVNLDQFAAVAVAPTSYLIQGQPYKAEVFLTAYDSKLNPSISVNGSSVNVVNGKGSYQANTSSEGVHSWYGTIKVKQADGTTKEYRTPEQKYQVARPSAVVSPKKMNVVYVGVDNPIAVSAPGIPKDKIRVSISGGSIKGSNGDYIVRVNTPGSVKINVTAEVSPGRTQTISSSEFRSKLIPDPKAKFAGKTGGTLSAAVVRGQDFMSVSLENFDFDAKFSLQRYTVIVAKPRADAISATGNGSTLSGSVKSALSGVVPGSTVMFTDIIAVGPDGVQRSLNPIAIRVN
jgi:gliding motility-associated protein GldM